MKSEIATAAVKISPPATVTGMTLFGIPLPDIAIIATIVYTGLMGVHLAYKFYWDVVDRRRKESGKGVGDDNG
ncbi:MAG: hypothetical protein LBF61_06005 [Azoarcus sp.]|jgi:hypothetical protein|nr:hypothetical protein [Azoarcus sp.]